MVTKIERKDMNFKSFFLIIVICGITQIQCKQDQQTLFSRAQKLFTQEHYQDAFNVYQRIEHKEFVVLHNMALCCLRQSKKAEALLFLKRAEKQARSFKELTLIEELIELNEDKEFQEKDWREQVAIFCKKSILATPILLLQGLILIGLMLLILCWYMQWYKKHSVISILFLIFWLLLYGIWSYRVDYIQTKYAVVMQPIARVFTGPDSSFNKKMDMSEAQLVTIIDKHDLYFKIKLDTIVGWVDSHDIELV